MDEGRSAIATRFAHLLQPIKDLTKNWDIDVASQLEEYLSELEQITITFDGGKTTMNFAEAALLIQGSAGVYSRKVEYLYALVYQTLDLIASKKKSGCSSSEDQREAVGEEDQSCTIEKRDPSDEFLTLDDVKEAANVDMVGETGPTNPPLSKLLCTVVPRTPMSLTPLSEPERTFNTPLYSKNGEILGNRMDFKMNTSTVHKSGALLLEPTNRVILELGWGTSYHRRVSTTWSDPSSPEQPPNEGDDQYDRGMEVDCVPHDTSFSNQPQQLSSNQEEGEGDDEVSVTEDTDSRLHPQSFVKRTQREEEDRENDILSSKKHLDPHKPVKSEKIPFKRGSTQKLPPSLVEEKKKKNTRKRRKSSTETHPPSISSQKLSEFLYHSFYSCSSQFPKNPFNAPSTAEFEAQFWSEQKRRKVSKAKENIKLTRLRKRSAMAIEEKLINDQETEENNEDGMQDGGGDETFFDPVGPENLVDGLISLQDNNNQMGQLFTRLEHTEPYQGVEPMAIEDQSGSTGHLSVDSGKVVQSYEEMVRLYIQSTLTAAVSYAQETELSKRVREWEERIKPTLIKEEQSSVFDIRSYGSDIIHTLSEKTSQECGFKELVKSKEPSEICRMFAASLQLANDKNVLISSKGEGDNSVDSMSLTLLSSQMSKDLITNYHAPSITAMTSSQSSSSVGEENVPEIAKNDNENVQTNTVPPNKSSKAKKTANNNKERKKR